MDVFAGITIQETVHLVTMLNYMNTLSDFLFSKSFIDENEKFQLLPVANGIYRYLEDDTPPIGIQEKMRILIKELIRESDIYSVEEKENPDAIFVNELFRRIITSIVFNNETNIYGFVIKIIRNSKVEDVGTLLDRIREELNQTLPGLVFERVFNDYILPMFPQPVRKLSSSSTSEKAKAALADSLLGTEGLKAEALSESLEAVTKFASSAETVSAALAESLSEAAAKQETEELPSSEEAVTAALAKTSLPKAELSPTSSLPEAPVNLTSIEFIYSQAGAIFFLSSSAHPEINELLTSSGASNIYDEYLHLAYAMKQLLTNNKIDIEFIRIFTLPALIYYVWNNREKLVDETTEDIVTNAEHRRKALEQLFFYLNKEINNSEIIVEEKLLRYQHQLEMAFYQSRTEIARNLIGRRCLLTNETKIDDEITRYKNNPGTFSCSSRKRDGLLPSFENSRSYEFWRFLDNGGSEEFLDLSKGNVSEILQDLNNGNMSNLLISLNNGNISNSQLNFNNGSISNLMLDLNNESISEFLINLINGNINNLLLDLNNKNITNLLMDLNNSFLPIMNNEKSIQIFLNLVARNIIKLTPSPNNTSTTEFLPNLNELFHQQNEIIAKNYFHCEKYVIEKLFHEKFIETPNNESVKISQGFFKIYYTARSMDLIEVQQLRKSDDLLKFHYFPSGKIVYYALIRSNSDIKLISEFGNERFRQQLGLSADEQFEEGNFKLIKEAGENFTIFVNRLARDREKMLRKNLNTIGYDATVQEMWFEYFFNLLTSFSVSSFLKLLTVIIILLDLKFWI